jgi:superfamily II DNA or RNA helicase
MALHEASLIARLPPPGELLMDADAIMDRFLDYVGDLGLELYPAQEEALLELLADKNVILATPTGSGKSLVALAFHFKAIAEDRRSYYTSPVKALVNEKFFALCEAFHPDNVGLMTGDATVNPDAPIICCTAEILANLALREGEHADVSYAVLDEFHYYSDRDRGVAWQIPLLALPQTRFLLMSATLGDVTFFEKAISELNGRPTVTVRSDERPVPLSYEYFEIALHETVAKLIETERAPIYLVNFTQRGCHDEAQSLMSVNVSSKDDKRAIAAELEGFRFDTRYGKDLQRFLRHGIGVHHGGMLPKYRRLVERLAKKGLLKVISGTDTLGVGVNIPIRSVVFTKLCKFDGEQTRILTVRDFKQISGRAGRKGYDDSGTVVVQAPPHYVENIRLAAKAERNPSKKKKVVNKKPPTRGYVHWNRATFEKLVSGTPEPLVSRFAVTHSMMLNLLNRDHGGCAAMKALIRGSHERNAHKHRHAKTAIQLFRSLIEADIMSLVDDEDRPGLKRVRVNVGLQREFSLTYALSLYVVETLRLLDEDEPGYPFAVLSLVEAILENPTVILRKQLDALKGQAVAKMKAEGLSYDERMEELEKLDYPKPNADFIYDSFNAFAAAQPWVGAENIKPKGAARELYEACHDFRSFVNEHKLERSEGVVLRYLSEVYKALLQNVPESARTAEVEDMIDYFGSVVRGVDASLLQEWEQLRDPSYVPAPTVSEPELAPQRGLTADKRNFTVLVRNAAFRLVQQLARGDFAGVVDSVQAAKDAEAWTSERIEQALSGYFEDHESIRTDPRARGTQHIRIDDAVEGHWRVQQILVDPDEHNDWLLELDIDLALSDEADRAVLTLLRIGS